MCDLPPPRRIGSFRRTSFKSTTGVGSGTGLMKNTRKCRACGHVFEVDQRNQHRHFYCSTARCQRTRRLLTQQKRRQRQKIDLSAKKRVAAPTRLHPHEKPTEADMIANHPLMIGLISMLTGSTDLQDIATTARQLYQRGRDILGPNSAQPSQSAMALR
jgi:hypothetical protein